MRRSPSTAPNPDYRDPRDYLRAGFFLADGKTIRPELLAERAVAMGRELLMRAVPLEIVGTIAKAVEHLAKAKTPFDERRAWLLARCHDPALKRYPTLLRLVQASVAALRLPADLPALARHLARVHQLAHFERTLGRAIALEQAVAQSRSVRSNSVRAYKKAQTPDGKHPRPGM